MSKTKGKAQVHRFLDMTKMKFRVTQVARQQATAPKAKALSMKMPWSKTTETISSQTQEDVQPSQLQFVEKLGSDAFLIGNEYQLDLITISSAKNMAVTDLLWEFAPSHPIQKLAIDHKKNWLVILGGKSIYIYRYDMKKIPVLMKTETVERSVKFMQFPVDNNLALFFDDGFQIIIIGDQTTRVRYSSNYKLNGRPMQIFLVPPSFEQVINMFFVEENQDSATFGLSCIEVTIGIDTVDVLEPQKIYDIAKSLKKTMKIDNFSKQIFLMNLGFQILAVKRGYIIDSANVNIQSTNSTLKFIGPDKLLLLTEKKVELYNFSMDKTAKPHRIVLKPKDSIRMNPPENSVYLTTHECSGENFIIFYQTDPAYNKRVDGQVLYWFTITQSVKLDEKINELFPKQQMNEIKCSNEILGERCDMALKMGLSVNEIFLELWNRTDRSSEQDYQLLLATKNYDTIKSEVQRKLKKNSMAYREVIRIEHACFEMLSESLFSTRCTEEVIQNYIICHFLIRKLELFKNNVLYERKKNNQADGKLFINIQQYNNYESCNIKDHVLESIFKFCFEQKDTILGIRLAIRDFRFVFRVIYEQFLENVVYTAKNQLLKILKEIPQLLPYSHTVFGENQDPSLFEGVWPDITREQWRQSLYTDSITTIDNRHQVELMVESVWFKRNWLSKHDLVTQTKEQVLEIHNKRNNSDYIFYFFIAKIFECIKDEDILKQIVEFLKETYTRLPENITGKIFLYDDLYRYLSGRKMLPENVTNFADFLTLKDYQLFHHFFTGQRDRKGLILKQIKPIYEKMGSNGSLIFNQSLLNYFKSDLSEVSDLKYVLNRINNEKKEFHQHNESMYEILVQAMLIKLKIGTEDDIPIDQVLVYVERIPLAKNNQIMQKLVFIDRIKDQTERFRCMKLDMSLQEIMECPEEVIHKMVLHEMEELRIMEIEDWDDFIQQTYQCLAAVLMRKERLFRTDAHYLPYFVYLCRLLEEESRIEYAARLLEDPFLISNFLIDMETVEDIVEYMYKWKFNEDPVYVNNEQYLLKIVQLLPQDNPLRIFRQNQIQFAVLLSSQANKVEYPITDDRTQVPSVTELEQIMAQTPASHILKLDLNRLYQVMNQMETLFYNQVQNDEIIDSIEMNPAKMITPHQIHETVIMRLIQLRRLEEVIKFMREIMAMETSDTRCNVVYPLIYITNISSELNNESWVQILRISCYYFNEPLKMLEILEHLIKHKMSNEERKQYLRLKVREGKKLGNGYSCSNSLFSKEVLSIINKPELKYDFINNIETACKRIESNKDQFVVNKCYSIFFRILCNEPYVLAKYLYIYRFETNWKFIRSFLSYAVNQKIFNDLNLLEFGRRIFACMLEAHVTRLPIETVISKFAEQNLYDDFLYEQIPIIDDIASKFKKSVEAFKKKKAVTVDKYEEDRKKQFGNELKTFEQEVKDLKNQSQKGVEGAPSEYPFEDSDDGLGEGSFIKDELKSKRQKKRTFDQREQIKRMAQKKPQNLKMTTGGIQQTYGIAGVTRSLRLSQGIESRQLGQSQKGFDTGASQRFNLKGSLYNQGDPMTIMREDSEILDDDHPSPQIKNVFNIGQSPLRQKQPIEQQPEDAFISKRTNAVLEEDYDRKQLRKSQQGIEAEKQEQFRIRSTSQVNQLSPEEQVQSIVVGRTENPMHRMNRPPQINPADSLGESLPFVHMPQEEDAYYSLAELIYEDNKYYLFGALGGNSSSVQARKPNFSAIYSLRQKETYLQDIRRVLQILYTREYLQFKQILQFFTEIQKQFPEIGLQPRWIDIYVKGENIHEKYSLDLPIRELFPFNGLFFDGRQNDELFNYIKPQMLSVLTDLNVYKTVKVISLAFRNSKIEQEVIFCYLKQMIRKNLLGSDMPTDAKQMQMVHEKINALVEKIKPDFLEERYSQIFEETESSDLKNELMGIITHSIAKRREK